MNRSASLLACAAALVACSGAPEATAQPQSQTPPVIDAARAPLPRVMTVAGAGEASAAPDLAVISIGVETRAPTAAEALRQNGVRMRATIEKLKARGVAEKDMQTQNLSVGAVYDYERTPGTPTIVGYQATNMLSVKLRDIAKAGAVLDDAVADGANSLSGLSFTFADPTPVEDAARADAIADARRRAAVYAQAAGVTLGPILQISDAFSYGGPPAPYLDVRAEAKSSATPIAVGESTVSASVTIVYEIR